MNCWLIPCMKSWFSSPSGIWKIENIHIQLSHLCRPGGEWAGGSNLDTYTVRQLLFLVVEVPLKLLPGWTVIAQLLLVFPTELEDLVGDFTHSDGRRLNLGQFIHHKILEKMALVLCDELISHPDEPLFYWDNARDRSFIQFSIAACDLID